MNQKVTTPLCHNTSDTIVILITDNKVLVSIHSIMSYSWCKTNF